jgi:hypothetical protein
VVELAGVPHLLEIQPVLHEDRAVWIGLANDGVLYRWDMDRGETRALAKLPDDMVDPTQPVTLKLSRRVSMQARGSMPPMGALIIEAQPSTFFGKGSGRGRGQV